MEGGKSFRGWVSSRKRKPSLANKEDGEDSKIYMQKNFETIVLKVLSSESWFIFSNTEANTYVPQRISPIKFLLDIGFFYIQFSD